MSPVPEQPSGSEPIVEAGVMLGLLWRANHELELLSKRMMMALGVTGPQRMVLRIIARKPGVSTGGICEAARIHASTLTGILERLSAAGARGVHVLADSDGSQVEGVEPGLALLGRAP